MSPSLAPSAPAGLQGDIERTMVEAAPVAMAYLDTGLRLVAAIPCFGQLHRVDVERALGLHLQAVIGADRFATVEPFLRRAHAGEVVRFGGSLGVTAVEVVLQPHRDARGEVVGIISISRDVTELKLAEHGRMQSESRFRALFDQSPVSLQLFSLDGNCTYANAAWERQYETTRDQLVGFNLLTDRQLEEKGLTPLIRRAMAGEALHVPAHLFVPAASGRIGRERWQEVFMFPVAGASGQVLELAVLAIDLTEVMVAQTKLKQAVQSRDDFLSMASHELRTPLTTVRLQLQMLQRMLTRTKEELVARNDVLPAVERTSRSAERLARLVDEMLDCARIESGRLTLARAPLSLEGLAREVLDRFELSLSAAGIQATLECSEPVEGSWDRDRLDQVLTNLITNAMRYAPNAPLRVAVARGGAGAEVRVQDGGPGIAPADHARIFERFEGLSAKKAGGLGLGLFIAREIAQAHGGALRVESAPGDGACFVLSLPLGAS